MVLRLVCGMRDLHIIMAITSCIAAHAVVITPHTYFRPVLARTRLVDLLSVDPADNAKGCCCCCVVVVVAPPNNPWAPNVPFGGLGGGRECCLATTAVCVYYLYTIQCVCVLSGVYAVHTISSIPPVPTISSTTSPTHNNTPWSHHIPGDTAGLTVVDPGAPGVCVAVGGACSAGWTCMPAPVVVSLPSNAAALCCCRY